MDATAEHAYESIAPVYDDFTAHYEYERWLDSVVAELWPCGLRKGRLLDVGCGTGRSFLPMLRDGWEVTACDLSEAMLEVARAKAREDVSLSVADIRELPVFGEFELVWALGNPVNYLLDPSEVEAAFAGMRANLASGGLLVFDADELPMYRSFFAEISVVERDGLRMTWRGEASPNVGPGSICQATFEVEGREVETHVHRQRHHPAAGIRAALDAAGLELLDSFGHGDDAAVMQRPVDEAIHSKAIYVARAV